MSERVQLTLLTCLSALVFTAIIACVVQAVQEHTQTKAALQSCREQVAAPSCRIIPRCVPVPAKPSGSL